MAFVFFLLAAFQVAQPAIIAPQGWSIRDTGIPRLEHLTGASLLVIPGSRSVTLTGGYARDGAERIMKPLGFARLSEPTHFQNAEQEWIQYEIWGNRLSD